jgi:hypothetical protein
MIGSQKYFIILTLYSEAKIRECFKTITTSRILNTNSTLTDPPSGRSTLLRLTQLLIELTGDLYLEEQLFNIPTSKFTFKYDSLHTTSYSLPENFYSATQLTLNNIPILI